MDIVVTGQPTLNAFQLTLNDLSLRLTFHCHSAFPDLPPQASADPATARQSLISS